MNKNLLLFFPLLAFYTADAQNFTGQWKGEFLDKSSAYVGMDGDKCEYVLELEVNGTSVSGSSYTYFTDEGKRYYTICKLEGYVDKKRKYIEVKETERTKTNVPINIRNCFQVHKLTYFKQGNVETIEGKWEPAPNQTGDCGYGSTVLSRRTLVTSYPNFNSRNSKSMPDKKPANRGLTTKPLIPAKNTPFVKKTPAPKPTQSLTKKETIQKEIPFTQEPSELPKTIIEKKNNPALAKLENRKNNVIRTIEVAHRTIKVDLYDNGEIDGDSVSLFYNGKLLLANKRLTDKALSINLTVDDDKAVNELVMYAENLGSIPPNTALMVVTDGPNRYEVRITSDLQKSGVINFVLKEEEAGK